MKFQDLDRHDTLFLLSIGEPADNQLRLIISEAGVIQEDASEPTGDASWYHLISAQDGAAIYELIFETYVVYSVRNESFAIRDDEEAWRSRLSSGTASLRTRTSCS